MNENNFVKRGKEKYWFFRKSRCNLCKTNTNLYDVIGLEICEDCIKNKITKISKITGNIKWRV